MPKCPQTLLALLINTSALGVMLIEFCLTEQCRVLSKQSMAMDLVDLDDLEEDSDDDMMVAATFDKYPRTEELECM
jgi:hypothetical protein